MPCHAAIDQAALHFTHDVKLEDALKKMKKSKVILAAVVDENKKLIGTISSKAILKSLIPVNVVTASGLKIDMRVTAAPGVSKRLHNVLPLTLNEVMDRKPKIIQSDKPLWEGVGLIVQHGNPLCVTDEKGFYLGLITYDSLLNHLINVEVS